MSNPNADPPEEEPPWLIHEASLREHLALGADPPEPGSIPANDGFPHIPGYEILGELGRGVMGVMYKARQLKLNRIVALKMVSLTHHATPSQLARFLREAQVLAAINNPHVIQMYEVGTVDRWLFMAMEYLEGGSLATRLHERGKLYPRAAAALVSKIARGVQAAHGHGIIHRDLKPNNVLLDTPPPNSPPGTWGEPKVTDFGLLTGEIMDMPAYMAPEQAMGVTKNIGPSADVYALGVILYECLSGTVPFVGHPALVAHLVVTAPPEPVSRRTSGVPRELDLICQKCLEKNQANRYQTAAELASDLDRFLCGKSVSVRPIGALKRVARWVMRRPARKPYWTVFLRGVGSVLNVFATPRFDYGKKPTGSSIDRAWRNTCRTFDTAINKPPPQS